MSLAWQGPLGLRGATEHDVTEMDKVFDTNPSLKSSLDLSLIDLES